VAAPVFGVADGGAPDSHALGQLDLLEAREFAGDSQSVPDLHAGPAPPLICTGHSANHMRSYALAQYVNYPQLRNTPI
jgi:hypothetical protein